MELWVAFVILLLLITDVTFLTLNDLLSYWFLLKLCLHVLIILLLIQLLIWIVLIIVGVLRIQVEPTCHQILIQHSIFARLVLLSFGTINYHGVFHHLVRLIQIHYFAAIQYIGFQLVFGLYRVILFDQVVKNVYTHMVLMMTIVLIPVCILVDLLLNYFLWLLEQNGLF